MKAVGTTDTHLPTKLQNVIFQKTTIFKFTAVTTLNLT